MNLSTPGLPVHHQLPESTQTHVHRVSDAIQPSHPLLSPSDLENSGIITCTCYQSDIYSVLFTNEAYVSVFIYLSNLCPRWGFVAVPGLVPRCGEWALLSSEMRRLLITPLLWKHSWQEAWTTGSLASGRVGSSQTRDRTCVPCTGGWILSHCTTREVQE